MTGLKYLNPPGAVLPSQLSLADALGAPVRPNGLLGGLSAAALRPNPYELVTRQQTVTLERRVWEALDRGETVNVPLFRP